MPDRSTASPAPRHFGGEEWRDIDTAPGHDNPADHDDVLRAAPAGIREHAGPITLTCRTGR